MNTNNSSAVGTTVLVVGVGFFTVPIAIIVVLSLFFTIFVNPIARCQTGATSAGGNIASVKPVDNATYKAPEHSDNPVRENLARFAESVALDDSHGYSQPRRGGNPDYDCSSLVYFAVTRGAGVSLKVATPFTTYNMGGVLMAAGFTHLTWSGNPKDAPGQLQRGDIIVNPSRHTEIYVGGGLFAGARHASPRGIDDGHPGDQGTGSKQEIGISHNITTSLYDVYRYNGDTSNTQGQANNPSSTVTQASLELASACMTSPSGGNNATTVAAIVPDDLTHASPEQARAYAKSLMGKYGWNDDDSDTGEFGCLVWVWNHESGWRWNADNPSSDAYGIPQSLPGSKMATIGPDWHDNAGTQIVWGMNYIKNRYKSPCGAKAFWLAHHWY
ncbi:peptidoglycan amidohydrolase family protein [Alloscardovia venturai]|uniref:Peptidoglycan amidohydrolase family protein n=1 Tax=Alloscardovia venturai TaxID=1769421 RepID=A0ABW2Y5S5_9BIFI